MGKDHSSWIHQQCPPHQAPNLNCASSVPDSGWQDGLPGAKPTGLVSNGTPTEYTGYRIPHYKTGLANGLPGWFYGLPRYRQALTPIPDCVPKDFNDYVEGHNKDVNRIVEHNKNINMGAGERPIEKKFLVFDHSGNQTRLIFNHDTAYPNQCLNAGNVRNLNNRSLGPEEWRTKTSSMYEGIPICSEGLDEKQENQETGEESEMHEDTEELNALLYSDEDDGYDCDSDEEMSTGHSPIKTSSHMELLVNASAEEVASSGCGHPKMKRVLDEEYSTSSLMDTASSGKPNGSSEWEDDAESSCGESISHGRELGSLPVTKRLKREKIQETVSILENIIPVGKGKDAIYVLDEAIHYLKSLKLKAKSMGETLE